MERNWKSFLQPYQQAVNELKIKLRGIRSQYLNLQQQSPIEFVIGRVKTIPSIKEKMKRRYISDDRLSQDMEDIAGLRIICPFIEDIYKVVNILRKRDDLEAVEERDYVKNNKTSGYRSYHMIFHYSVPMITGQKKILVEIQIRTLAMNFWATVEHSLHYKYDGIFPDYLEKKLQKSADLAYQLDQNMSNIRAKLRQTKQPQNKSIDN
ncbi:GTP pyrophosphokinase [Philodulcilactobacillus myokoensis]|uniref:GTP pyrophosphokinase n=1 Tax=Philodulcilactobacillus myokoensis TaxID=2929573 RepID=A0A9W6ET56_9LACO|nr:GTP pyrophosphokinase family protein [Philodulcilactobacillus myokoensis]GLB47033.1 GTP pyrophosphokinase [Philodulcilactobacillus myokoensis]